MPKRKSTTPTGPAQKEVGQLVVNILDLNADKIVEVLVGTYNATMTHEELTNLSRLVRGTCDQTRGLALQQVVKLYD
tara:strand:+ start:10469 stop:10699 length:231 start_codon:yes stop_codon:yes gene_type:complete